MSKTSTKTAMPEIEVPAGVREFAEKSVDQAQVVYGQFRDAAQETVDMLDESATALKDGTAGVQIKAIDFAQANILSGFDLARKMIAAKDAKEVVDLQAGYARDQVKVVTEQARELSALYAKVTEDASRPLKAGVSKSFEKVKSALPA